MSVKPTHCIDPVIKYCQGCNWGWVKYPDWVETREDLADCTFESGCILGFDQGRPEDEPTAEELAEFEHWCKKLSENIEQGEIEHPIEHGKLSFYDRE